MQIKATSQFGHVVSYALSFGIKMKNSSIKFHRQNFFFLREMKPISTNARGILLERMKKNQGQMTEGKCIVRSCVNRAELYMKKVKINICPNLSKRIQYSLTYPDVLFLSGRLSNPNSSKESSVHLNIFRPEQPLVSQAK